MSSDQEQNEMKKGIVGDTIARIISLSSDEDRPLAVRFVATLSLATIGITAFLIGAVTLAVAVSLVIFTPLFTYNFVEFGLYPWESYDRELSTLPLLWQVSQLLWGILLLSLVFTIAHLSGGFGPDRSVTNDRQESADGGVK